MFGWAGHNLNVDRRIAAQVDASPEHTMAALADLATYPEWLNLVASADPDPRAPTATWIVTLRARLGPLARSKRLRMTRTQLDDSSVRFERSETDGRDHAEWVLRANVSPVEAGGSTVVVDLHYGGALWSTPIEIALSGFEGTAADRLGEWLSNS